MTRPLRVAVVGLGHHGRRTAELVLAAGGQLVAVADPSSAGRPANELIGGAPTGLTVTDGSGPLFPAGSADIAVVAARLDLAGLEDVVSRCLRADADVITIAEYAFDPAALGDTGVRLDELARQVDRSFVVSGVQDVCWVGIVLAAVGATRDLRRLTLSQHHGVDGYPVPFLTEVGAGATDESFQSEVIPGLLAAPPVLGAVLPVLAAALGFTPVGALTRRFEPVRLDRPLASASLDRTIPAGQIVGVRERVVLSTREGVIFQSEHATTARPPGEDDTFEAELDAAPRLRLTHRIEPGPDAVDATVVNRLLDVVTAPSGLQSTTSLGAPRPTTKLLVEARRGA